MNGAPLSHIRLPLDTFKRSKKYALYASERYTKYWIYALSRVYKDSTPSIGESDRGERVSIGSLLASRYMMYILINSKSCNPIVVWCKVAVFIWHRARRELPVKCSEILLIFKMWALETSILLYRYTFSFVSLFTFRLNC